MKPSSAVSITRKVCFTTGSVITSGSTGGAVTILSASMCVAQKNRAPTTLPARFRLSGGLGPLWPALVIGQYAHVGRGASVGLGRYRLSAVE